MIDPDNLITVWQSEELPESVAAAIARQLPGVDLDNITDAADAYRVVPMLLPPDAKSEKVALERLARHADMLANRLSTIGWEARGKLNQLLRSRGLGKTSDMSARLSVLSGAALETARNLEINKGRPQSEKRHLVRELAEILSNAGFEVSAKPGGPLVYLVTEVLMFCDGEVGDVRSLVRNCLR